MRAARASFQMHVLLELSVLRTIHQGRQSGKTGRQGHVSRAHPSPTPEFDSFPLPQAFRPCAATALGLPSCTSSSRVLHADQEGKMLYFMQTKKNVNDLIVMAVILAISNQLPTHTKGTIGELPSIACLLSKP